jgi:hypothetical protein
VFNYDLAHLRQEALRQEAAYDRMVEGLTPQSPRNIYARGQHELLRVRNFVTDLGKTKPVRRRVESLISPQ